MIFEREGIYTLAFLTGSKHRVYGVPFPLDDAENTMTYSEMITTGMKQLKALELIENDKPNELCERYIYVMSEYVYKGNYFRIDQFHYATEGTVSDYASYIEEVEGGKYRLYSALKPVLIASVMNDYRFLAKLDNLSIGKWEMESLLSIQIDHGNSLGFIMERITDYKTIYQGGMIEFHDKVIEYDMGESLKRELSGSSAVKILNEYMNTPNYPLNQEKEDEHNGLVY